MGKGVSGWRDNGWVGQDPKDRTLYFSFYIRGGGLLVHYFDIDIDIDIDIIFLLRHL